MSEVKEVEDAFRKEHTQSIADNNACAAVPVVRECGAARKRINKRDGETELKSIKWGCFGRYELWYSYSVEVSSLFRGLVWEMAIYKTHKTQTQGRPKARARVQGSQRSRARTARKVARPRVIIRRQAQW